ncbi:MAG TPA: 2-phosphosulfolactate phosphatase [Candidatus Sulfotelmatobacter sp.]|nr:2-phosphosulfolactate phosphatase [Candidatus Sulfotelmatobacter sp.]
MRRSIDVLLAPPWPPENLRGTQTVVFDVLRATSTIAAALANGASGVIPVVEPDEAVALGARLGRDRVLLCGERNVTRLAGFDLGNSPAAMTPDVVTGKTIVMTTTNGTRAIRAAANAQAASVRTCALLNRTAVADALAVDDGPIAIVCSGEKGAFAFEDAIGAGALVDALLSLIDEPELHDGARAAALLYRSVASRLADAIASSDHAQEIAAKGFAADLTRCAALDRLAVVPTLREGVLTAG